MTVIETARLQLRPFTLDDIDAYHTAIRSDPDVMRYMPGRQAQPREASERVVRSFIEYWEQNGYGSWAVVHRVDDRLIGQVGLQLMTDHPATELYYALAKAYWQQGLAPEAARAVLRYGFETVGLERIVAVFVPENTASERVMAKIGMRYAGPLACYNTELPCYAITRAEFQPGDHAYAAHAEL